MKARKGKIVYRYVYRYLCVSAHTCMCMYTFNSTAAKSFPACCKFIKICACYRCHLIYIYISVINLIVSYRSRMIILSAI